MNFVRVVVYVDPGVTLSLVQAICLKFQNWLLNSWQMSITIQVKMSSKNYRASGGKFNFFTVAITIFCGLCVFDHPRSKKVFLEFFVFHVDLEN